MQGGGRQIWLPRHFFEAGSRENEPCTILYNWNAPSVVFQHRCVLEKGLCKQSSCIVPSRSGSRTHAAKLSNDQRRHRLIAKALFICLRKFFYFRCVSVINAALFFASNKPYFPMFLRENIRVGSCFNGIRQAWIAW